VPAVRGEPPVIATTTSPVLPASASGLRGASEYTEFIKAGAPGRVSGRVPATNVNAIALNYTSGTTVDPRAWTITISGAQSLAATCLTCGMPPRPV